MAWLGTLIFLLLGFAVFALAILACRIFCTSVIEIA
jgi:hypothetical protein